MQSILDRPHSQPASSPQRSYVRLTYGAYADLLLRIPCLTRFSNLPFKITPEEMYDIFGKYGAIRQIRVGDANDTKGTAFVIYEDIFDAKTAYEHLQGFNIMGRYLIVLYYQPNKVTKKMNLARKEEELKELKTYVR